MRPFFVEFTGTPFAGKTTCIEQLKIELSSKCGLNVEVITDISDIVPPSIPIDHFDYTHYRCFATILDIIEYSHHECDIVLVDKGYWDCAFYLHYLLQEKTYPEAQVRQLFQPFMNNSLQPNLVLALFCSYQVAQERGLEAIEADVAFVHTETTINLYNSMLQANLDTIRNTTPNRIITTSDLLCEQIVKLSTYYIIDALMKFQAQNQGTQ